MQIRYFLFAVGAAAAIGYKADRQTPPRSSGSTLAGRGTADSKTIADGRDIFRFDTYGDETFWTDTLRMHEVIRTKVSPLTALSVGLKVDADALPAAVVTALQNKTIDLNNPATTVTLIKLGAVVGVVGQVDAKDTLRKVGITCAFCHSTVDNSLAPGIGHRRDGWPNRDLNVGAIVALSPAVTAAQKAVYQSWGPGKYDPRFNVDGKNIPVVIPPAFGLRRVGREIYTGDDTISYWNAYVAITQMHGHGRFVDPRIGVAVNNAPDLVSSKLAALRTYQFSLETPPPVSEKVDKLGAAGPRGVQRGRALRPLSHTDPSTRNVTGRCIHQPMTGRIRARA